MELFFRKYFWVVNLVFLLLAAFLAAKTVNAFIYPALAPLPDFSQPPPGPALPQAVEKAALTPEAMSKLTGIALPPAPEVVEPTAEEPAVDLDSQTPVKTSLRVRLVGTMVANVSEWSMANIEDEGKTTRVYMVGDAISGASILEIERMRVIINNNGRKEFIDAEMGAGEPTHVPTVAAVTPPPSNGGGSGIGAGIRATGDNTYEVPKTEIDRALGNLNDIAMQARIVPAFKDGVATGFKLFSIRPDSLYSKIGIQNGDVIRRINGYEINSPDKALEVYSKLKESSRIEIEIDRNGSVQRKTYNVR